MTTWAAINKTLDRAERVIPSGSLLASRVFGLTIGAALGIPMWTWNAGAWGWTLDGSREPLRYRLSCALLIWRTRYWTRCMESSTGCAASDGK